MTHPQPQENRPTIKSTNVQTEEHIGLSFKTCPGKP